MITTVTYARLYNLGNYENEKLEVTVTVEENDVTAAFITAIATIELEHARLLNDRRTPRTEPMPPASDKQRSYIANIQDELGWTSEQLAVYANEQGVDLVTMSKAQASTFINGLKRLADQAAGPPPF